MVKYELKIVVPMEKLINKLFLVVLACNLNLFMVTASDSIRISNIKETYRLNDTISISLLNTTSKEVACSCSFEFLKDSSWVVYKEDVLGKIPKAVAYLIIPSDESRGISIDLESLKLIYLENFEKNFYRLKFSTSDTGNVFYSSPFTVSP